jgi:release factor glutamine methyltransferase
MSPRQEPARSASWSPPALIREGARRLEAAGLDNNQHEAEWLLAHLLGIPALELHLWPERDLPPPLIKHFFSCIAQRAVGTPLQYLLGETEFFGAAFAVEPGVFIPRPETEAVMERALEALRRLVGKDRRPLRLLDLGTGSGCIAVTLARELSPCLVVGVELSWETLSTARRNVRRHGVEREVRLVQGCWTDPLRGMFDGMVSNPPYVPSGQVDRLPLDVRREPRLSLDGGPDGMCALAQVLAEAPRVLRPGGVFALECGEEQVERLARLAAEAVWVEAAKPIRDLAGRPRGMLITRRG